MRGLRYRPGMSWPRNPARGGSGTDPETVRRRTRAAGPPITPNALGR